MRGAYGKPEGVCARVKIGQPLISVRTHEKYVENAIEALRRCKFKFAGRQKLVVSNKWGFHQVDEGRLPTHDGRRFSRSCRLHCQIRTKPWSSARWSGNQKPKLQSISLQDAALVGVPWLPR